MDAQGGLNQIVGRNASVHFIQELKMHNIGHIFKITTKMQRNYVVVFRQPCLYLPINLNSYNSGPYNSEHKNIQLILPNQIVIAKTSLFKAWEIHSILFH